jgi:hypothetical protein
MHMQWDSCPCDMLQSILGCASPRAAEVEAFHSCVGRIPSRGEFPPPWQSITCHFPGSQSRGPRAGTGGLFASASVLECSLSFFGMVQWRPCFPSGNAGGAELPRSGVSKFTWLDTTRCGHEKTGGLERRAFPPLRSNPFPQAEQFAR